MIKPNLNVVSEAAFKIETNVQIPISKRTKYPFGEMEVGHSFSLSMTEYPGVTSAASWFGKRNNRKYSVRKDGDGYRCWRVS